MSLEMFKIEVDVLLDMEYSIEKRCKGTQYFGNFQIF
jgi:hypothetical protein